MHRKLLATAVFVLSLGLLTGPTMAQNPDNVKEFMRAKLTHVHKLTEALAVENFDALVKHSQELELISQAATWQVMSTAEYLDHSKEFQRSTQALNTAAKKRNLDGAALAFVEMTLKCVNCHKYVRRIRTAQIGPPLGAPAIVHASPPQPRLSRKEEP